MRNLEYSPLHGKRVKQLIILKASAPRETRKIQISSITQVFP